MLNQPRMLRLPFSIPGLALVAALAVACQSGPKVSTTVTEAPGSLVVVQTVETQATVTAIDAINRTVTLKPRRGEAQAFKVGEGAINFEQVRVGDEVHAVVVEETAINLVSGGAPASAAAATTVALAPEGERPGVFMANVVETTGTVIAIDGHSRTVTLQFQSGRIKELNVGKNRDMTKVGLGDSVRIQLSEAIAIAVVKP